MKRLSLAIVSLFGLVASAFAQTSYNRFGPVNGVLVGDSSTYYTSAADSSDIRALWSGTCDVTTFLRGDGTCTSASSSGSPLTRVDDTNVTLTLGGSPSTSLLAATSLTLGWNGQLSVSRGGTGGGTFSGVLKGNGTSAFSSAASTDIRTLWSGTCDATTYLRGDGSCQAPPGTGGGTVNSVGLSAPSMFSVTGSPVTTNGTLALDFATGQTANRFLATPNGSTGAVALRAIVAGDLPAISLTSGVTGTLPVGNGGTGVTSLGNLTKADDTNVTLTLGGTPTGALINSTSITAGWTGQLAASRGGTGVSSLGNLTKADDTNVTLTLGGTPTGALINSTSITAGWSGQLAVGRGGTGASTLSGLLKGNGTSAIGAAAASDVTATFSGTCNSGTFLRGDGTCVASGGASAPITCTTACSVAAIVAGQEALTRKSGTNTSRSSNTSPTYDPDLQFTSVPVGNYTADLQFSVVLGTSTTQGLRLSILGDTGDAMMNCTLVNLDATSGQIINVTSTVDLTTGFTAGTQRRFDCHGTVSMTSTGTIGLRWAQAVSSANLTTVNSITSFLRIQRIN